MLPVELLIHVFSFLDPKADKANLQNCALVSTTWFKAVQPAIYSHLTLSVTSPLHEEHRTMSAQAINGHERLLNSLKDQPYLASYITTLRLKTIERHGLRQVDDTWVKESLSVASVIGKLTNVQKLILFRMGPLNTLTPTLREAIQSHFLQPTITQLDIGHSSFESFSQVMEMIYTCPNLIDISLISVKFLDDSVNDHDLRSLQPRRAIRSLYLSLTRIEPFARYFGLLSSPIDAARLESLTIRNPRDPSGVGAIGRLLSHAGHALKYLELEEPLIPEQDDNLHVGHCLQLKTLLLIVRHDQTTAHSPIPWIRSIFSASKCSFSAVEAINLQLELDVPVDFENTRSRFLAPWRGIDSLWSSVEMFPHLRTVTITLWNYGIPASRLDILDGEFPMLQKAGKLKIVPGNGIDPMARIWR